MINRKCWIIYTWAGERKRKCEYIPGHVLAFKLGVIVVDASLCFLNYICIKCILVYQILPNARHFEKHRSGHVVQSPAESLQNGDGAGMVRGDQQDTLPADGGPAHRPHAGFPPAHILSGCLFSKSTTPSSSWAIFWSLNAGSVSKR